VSLKKVAVKLAVAGSAGGFSEITYLSKPRLLS
jgi:hypothetical protein